jgi:hypothetical protein
MQEKIAVVYLHHSFMHRWDPGRKNFRIQDKQPVSATLLSFMLNFNDYKILNSNWFFFLFLYPDLY